MILLADVGRGLVVVVLAAVLVMSYVTLRRYGNKERNKGPDRLRSRHVRRVAVSHVGALSLIGVDVGLRFGRPPTFRLPFALLFSVLTFSALLDLMVYQRQAKGITGRRHDDPR